MPIFHRKKVKKVAAKKIGAIIALDGEKEFKQNVTACNKSLTSLKSEMNLVKAECEGQQNSLESLTKKHEVLTKILNEQQNKEQEVVKGLEHAKSEYRKVEDGLQTLNQEQEQHTKKLSELQEEYKKAAKELKAMEKAGDSSEQSMSKQQEAVKSLSESIKKEQDTLDELSAAIIKGNKNYQTAGNRIKDWETLLNNAKAQVIEASAAVNKNAAYMKEAEQATDKCASSIDEYGKEVKKAEKVTVDFATVVKMNIGNTVADVFKNTVTAAAGSMLDMESAQRQLQASTGATTGEMQQYKKVMEELHSNNYGQDIQDVADSMALVKQYTGDIDASALKEMTEDGIAMRDVFGMDLSETIRGVDSLMENMGLTSEDAFDLMAKGAQNGLDKSGELADNIAEYGQLWAQAGFSAEEMFTILQNGLDSGAYNLDKVNDFVKEFTISLADGRIEENLKHFSSGTRTLFQQWKTGKATAKDVFQSVVNDLATAENQQEALTIASETWSALGEDNAMKVITSLNKTNQAYKNVQGTMEDIKKIKYDTLEARFQSLGKKFQTEVAVPIAEKALPAMEEGLDLVIENMDLLIPAMSGVAVGAVAFKTVSAAVEVYELATKKATVATEGATVAQKIFNLVQNANPIALTVTALVAAGTALAVYAEFAGEATKEVQRLAEKNQKVCDSANEVSESVKELTANYADSTEEMQAQGQYAESLADNLKKLTEQENLSAEQKSVACQYVSQLNELVPGLNLAYDEQANKLSMTNEQLEEYLSNNQKQIEQQAAQEYAIELLKKKSELEVEAIKLENQQEELGNKKITMLDKIGALTFGLQQGNMDYYQTIKELSEAQKENTDAVTENEAQQKNIQEQIEANSEYIDQITQKTNENTDATNTNAEAQAAAAESNAVVMQGMADTYSQMQQKVSEVLDSQMNMFEEFNAGTEISSQKLLENMQSQIDGVTNWADNMAVLADRGVNQGIIDKLAEMGPQGSTYVQAFASMTDEQLKQANEMWSKSIDMRAGVESSVQGMIEQYAIALNGGKDRINALMGEYGVNTVQGLISAISASETEVSDATRKVGDAATQGYKDEMEIKSPSRVFKRLGEYTVEGLISGIKENKSESIQTVKNLADDIAETAEKKLSKKKFKDIGENVASGIAAGLKSGGGTVQRAVESLYSKVKAPELNKNTLYSEGRNVSEGLANGIRAGKSEVVNAVAKVCNAAVSEARRKLDIHSPSKVFERLGAYTAEGFGIGYENKMQNVNGMIRDSMEIPDMRSKTGAAGGGTGGWPEKLVVELPIYTGNTYSKTEIVEIAMAGIAQKQTGRLNARGLRLSGV